MKKYLLSAICTFIACTASADPTAHYVSFTCPAINVVANFGDYIAGYGSEWIMNTHIPVYFKSTAWPSGIPSNLNTYNNSATNYDSVNAQIICSYMSTNTDNSSFDLLYYVTNGTGGLVTAQTNDSIDLQLPVGLSKS